MTSLVIVVFVLRLFVLIISPKYVLVLFAAAVLRHALTTDRGAPELYTKIEVPERRSRKNRGGGR